MMESHTNVLICETFRWATRFSQDIVKFIYSFSELADEDRLTYFNQVLRSPSYNSSGILYIDSAGWEGGEGIW